ncbi:MAG: RecQ family ATP-dependent DNA helicase [Treponema sp.]|nr:RecQ family ATP-dependent DNA helicase [Treponema sp.]
MGEIEKIDAENLYDEDLVGRLAFENFGIRYLFPWQRMVIANILEAYEYHELIESLEGEAKVKFERENGDSFCKGRQVVLLPTGAGKSLCFQIPAFVFDGPTLIIYPLLALMTDQQRRMESGSLRSVIFRGGQSELQRRENFEKIKNGAKIIIANPEVLQSEHLLRQLKEVGIKHIAIDEAHCVSEWGDSFRSSYLSLGKVIEFLKPPVITAFTATASPDVLSRVSEILFGGEVHVVRSESDRQNIHYFVRQAAAKKKEALYLAKTEARPMIIFCGTRDKAEDMAQELNVCFGRGSAKFYHAGLSKEEKEFVEKWFFESKDGVLCATCAYGMGVDKKDIKTVVHLQAPGTAEAYIQEAGRGGRDGSVAKAILLWSLEDSVNFNVFKPDSREAAMKKFAETTDCRRQVLLDALGAEKAVCSGCDLCNEREYKAGLIKQSKSGKIDFRVRYDLFKYDRQKYVSDWEMTYGLVRKNKNYYSEEELEEVVTERMSKRSLNKIGLNVWNHFDSVEVVRQLKESGRLQKCNFLWKDKLKAAADDKNNEKEKVSNP